MAVAPAECSTVPIDKLPNEVLTEVMLRVLTLADLVHAAAVSKRWRRVIATQEFLGAYRKSHKSSPFLGLYIPRKFGGLPSFEKADSIQLVKSADLDLQRAAAMAFSLGGLESHPEWRLLDCYNGRLLLARGNESLKVYNPLSQECILVCLPQDNILPHYFSACLLQGHGDEVSSFRVVSVQHERPPRVRAIEYDSRCKSWKDHPWETLKTNIQGTEQVEVMHAGNLVFCKYTGTSLLLLDTSKMEFSVLPLPADNNPKNYAIGEMEDGVCCLASVDSVGIWNKIYLRLWKLDKLEWKLDNQMLVEQVLGEKVLSELRLSEHASLRRMYYRVRAVTNGIALLCLTSREHQLDFVVDLKTFGVKDKFEFKDLAFPMQIPWPPTFSMVTVSDEQSTSSTGAHKNSSVTAVNGNVVNEAQNHVYEMMNPGSNEGKNPGASDGNNDNRPKLRNGTAPQNCMPSNAREGLGIQDPVGSVPTPTASEECFEKENDVLNDYDLENDIQERQHNWGPIQVCIKQQRCFEDWDDSEGESPGSCKSDSISSPCC